MIAILCPTKGRPDKLKRMWDSAIATAKYPDKLSLWMGVNEEEVETYSSISFDKPTTAVMMACKDWSITYTLNILAEYAKKRANFFMLMGDDAVFTTPHWDEAVYNNYDTLQKKAHVFALRDSRSADGTPHPIVTREWLDIVGYVACPIFLHWFVDTWLVGMAKLTNRFTHLKEFLLEHRKPSDVGEFDATHLTPRERGWHDRDKFVNDKLKPSFFVDEVKRIEEIMRIMNV